MLSEKTLDPCPSCGGNLKAHTQKQLIFCAMAELGKITSKGGKF